MPESSAKRWIALCFGVLFFVLVACDEQRGKLQRSPIMVLVEQILPCS